MGPTAEYSRYVNRLLDDAQRACQDDYLVLHRHMEQAKAKGLTWLEGLSYTIEQQRCVCS
ncbi:MAG: hypothetical protein ACRYFU_12000 [Janthinobacterium lividum]